MKRKFFASIVVLSVFLSSCVPTDTQSAWYDVSEVQIGVDSISGDEIADLIEYLASSALEGRRSGTPGGLMAAEYIRDNLKDSSFLPAVPDYFQEFSFYDLKDHRSEQLIEFLKNSGYNVEFSGRNVAGIIEGAEKPDEYIVLVAHYDHIGLQKDGMHLGADDNASGTAAVLEIAEALGILSQNGIYPSRSIIVLFADAEEWGLWGSKYFAANSPVPVEDIVAVVNLDMVGRNDVGEVWVIGSPRIDDFSDRNPQLARATDAAAKITGIKLVYPVETGREEQIFYRSDQASFYFVRANPIPVVFYTAGLHPDYHTPADTADKVNNEKVRDIARFALFVIWGISEFSTVPVYNE
ncbi:MAG: M28 family peptidase [Candidatus Spechtbacterales bacterium]